VTGKESKSNPSFKVLQALAAHNSKHGLIKQLALDEVVQINGYRKLQWHIFDQFGCHLTTVDMKNDYQSIRRVSQFLHLIHDTYKLLLKAD